MDETIANVTSATELENAVNDTKIETINLLNDISLSRSLSINHALTLKGDNNHEISFKNVTTGNAKMGALTVNADNVNIEKVGIEGPEANEHGIVVYGKNFKMKNSYVHGSGGYNTVVYHTINATFTGVAFENAGKGGILVASSSATVEDVATRWNKWGGIEVSETKDELGVSLGNSKLTVKGNHVHIPSADDQQDVAIWIDDATKSVGRNLSEIEDEGHLFKREYINDPNDGQIILKVLYSLVVKSPL